MRNKVIDNMLSEESIDKESAVLSESLDYRATATKTKWNDSMTGYWVGLPERDRMALMILVLFLVLVVGGYGGYVMHQKANLQQVAYQTVITDYFWLRGQASNIDPKQNQAANDDVNQKITQMLNSSGVSDAQVLKVGESVQTSFTHPNQAVVSNILGNLVNAGLSIDTLIMTQDPKTKQIRVQATVSA